MIEPQSYAIVVRQDDDAHAKSPGKHGDVLTLLKQVLGSEVSLERDVAKADIVGREGHEVWDVVNTLSGILLVTTDATHDKMIQAVSGLYQVKRLCLLLRLVSLDDAIENAVAKPAECQHRLQHVRASNPAIADVSSSTEGILKFIVVAEKRGRISKKVFSKLSVAEASKRVSFSVANLLTPPRCNKSDSSQDGRKEGFESACDLARTRLRNGISTLTNPPEIYVALVASRCSFGAAIVGITLFNSHAMPDLAVGNGDLRTETRAFCFFQNVAKESSETAHHPLQGEVSVIGSGIDDPMNIGSIFRLMACFGATSKLILIHPERGRGAHASSIDDIGPESPEFLTLPHIAHKISSTAVGTQNISGPAKSISMTEFLEVDQSESAPLVVLETAEGASSIHDFKFPQRCRIVVGSEGNGVSKTLLASLQRQRGDAAVYIPMPGPHPSLNVAAALACALYEYRKQWPI